VSRRLLDGKTALISGAAGGIGRVLVQGFLEAGANVVAADVDEPGLAHLEGKLRPDYPVSRLVLTPLDVADYAACERVVQQVQAGFDGIHIVINNAALGMGAIRHDHFSRPVGIQEIDPAVWQRFMAVNFSGAWNLTRASIGPMLAQRWGRIINVTTSFFTMLRGGFQPYGPSKAGLEAMSLAHAREFEGRGVTVNVVVPGGPADTAMVPDDIGVDRAALIAPAVLIRPMVWLCSNEAQDVTGNRYVAAQWDSALPPDEAERACRAPAAWPNLAQNPVWPGGKPDR
jgi:NAD(P)-dependent dehydrogenase (short-subunit alcohol dehydrogenase family)